MLFEMRHMKKARTNFNIGIDEAMRQSLMGELVGDIAFQIGPGVGVRLLLTKHPEEESGEGIRVRTEKVEYTDRSGEIRDDLSEDVHALLAVSGLLEKNVVHSDSHISLDLVADPDAFEFAHQSLVKLFGRAANGQPNWRQALQRPHVTDSVRNFEQAVSDAFGQGVVSLILHLQPQARPSFLPKRAAPRLVMPNGRR